MREREPCVIGNGIDLIGKDCCKLSAIEWETETASGERNGAEAYRKSLYSDIKCFPQNFRNTWNLNSINIGSNLAG